jgi:hypothetical protein
MHVVKVTYSDPVYTELGREAHLAGVSVAQFVREATEMRLVYRKTLRGELEAFRDETPSA